MLPKKLNKHCLEPILHAQEAMTLYGDMNYGSAPIFTPLAPTPWRGGGLQICNGCRVDHRGEVSKSVMFVEQIIEGRLADVMDVERIRWGREGVEGGLKMVGGSNCCWGRSNGSVELIQ